MSSQTEEKENRNRYKEKRSITGEKYSMRREYAAAAAPVSWPSARPFVRAS